MTKVMICIPCYDRKIWTDTMVSLIENFKLLNQCGIDYTINFIGSESLITRARNVMASRFLASDCDYLLFIDSDLSFESNAIAKLINSGKEVIGMPYAKKRLHMDEIIEQMKNGMLLNDAICKTNDYIFNIHNKEELRIENGCLEIDELGTGGMLIKREVLLSLIEKGLAREYKTYQNEDTTFKHYEFFQTTIDDETSFYLSEDFFFSKMVRKAGYKVWLRVDIKVNHLGQEVFIGDFMKKLLPVKKSD